MPRKYRSSEERTQICKEVREFITGSMGLPFDDEELKSFYTALDEFEKSPINGRSWNGQVTIKSFGCCIEYALPGRRIQPHFARLKKLEGGFTPPIPNLSDVANPALL